MESISNALRLKKELDTMRPFNEDDEARIMQKFRLDWNFHSNNLEGNSLSYGETKALILFGITASGKPLKDHFEITGHNKAINEILDVIKQERPLTESFIRELHKLILKEPYKSPAITPDGKPSEKTIQVGTYKTSPNHVKTVTGEIFRFATPEETPAKMHDLINWYRAENEKSNINPITLAAEFHYKFVRIHPFDDGNGRLARILMNFILLQHGFPPVIVRTQDKQNYIAAIRQADAGLIEPFVDYIAKNLVQSLELMIRGAKGEDIEDADDVDKAFALLGKRIEGLGTGKKVYKTNEIINKLCKEDLSILFNKFIEKNKKFEEYYGRLSSSVNLSEENFSGWVDEAYDDYIKDKLLTGVKIDQRIDALDGRSYSDSYRNFKQTIDIFGYFRVYKPSDFTFAGEDYIIEGLDLEFDFSKFNINRYDFDYAYQIVLVFNESDFVIKYSEGNHKLTKNYGEQLTEKEIDKIVNSEIKRHTDFIQQKLDEAEKKDKQ